MQSTATTPADYVSSLPDDRKDAMEKLRKSLKENLPKGFEEVMASGMVNFVVPYSIYPAGYHCKPKQRLPFIAIASQKNFIAIYHMGLYADPDLLQWFTSEYPKHSNSKLDMGKSCIRFKKPAEIPFTLLEELFSKMTPHDWIALYEKNYKKQ